MWGLWDWNIPIIKTGKEKCMKGWNKKKKNFGFKKKTSKQKKKGGRKMT